MKLVPVGDHLVVKRVAAEDRTAGGIVLPDAAKQSPRQGRVLAVGDGKLLKNGQRAEPSLGEGDRVVFSAYAGNPVTIDGEDLLVMSEDEILAIIK